MSLSARLVSVSPRRLVARLGAWWVVLGVTGFVAASAVAAPPPTTHVTKVFELREMEPERAAALHARLLGSYPGSRVVVADGRKGRLVVHDTRDRLAWFARIVALLDVPGDEGARIYARPVVYRTPEELVILTRDVLGEAGRDVVMVPDQRSSTLLVRTDRGTYAQLDRLLRRLDRPAGRDHRRAIRVTPAPADGGKNLPLPGVRRTGGHR